MDKNKVKPLLIEMDSFDKDIGNVVQIARAEAQKILKCRKVKILDVIRYRPYGWIVMVLNKEHGCSNNQGVGKGKKC